MGRIKSLLIKRTSKQLLIKDNARFTTEFNHNKVNLGNSMPSKSTRNKIAGYIARLRRMETKVKKVKKTEDMPVRDYGY